MSDWVVLGRMSGLFGVQGWVRVFSHTEPREGITATTRCF
jgi:16S rRNA processing protein RimM